MVTLFIKAKVRAYADWKPGYDEFAQKRKEKGVTAASVHRDIAAQRTDWPAGRIRRVEQPVR